MNTLQEEWRPVIGWEGLYEVSDQGRVRSLPKVVRSLHGSTQQRPGRIRTLSNNGQYLHVTLSDVPRRWMPLVHRIVAMAFLGPIPEGMQVNHKNGNKLDNRACNLEYVTPRGNSRHARRLGLVTPVQGEAHGAAKLTEEQALEIRRCYGRERTGVLARRFGVTPSTICDIAMRRSWRHLP